MDDNTKYIIKYFNNKTNEFIGYQCSETHDLVYLTNDIHKATSVYKKYVQFYMNFILFKLRDTFKEIKNYTSPRTQQGCTLTSNDFKDLKIKDVSYKIVEFNKELRLLKIKKML